MVTFSELSRQSGQLAPIDVEWLNLLLSDWQMVADLVFADLVLWIPDGSGKFIAAGHARPSSSATIFYRDIDGEQARKQWANEIETAYEKGQIVTAEVPTEFEGSSIRLSAIPVRRHTNLSDLRTPNKLQLNYLAAGQDLLEMITEATFPSTANPGGARRATPRITDGILRLDEDGTVTFASPNAFSAFARMGLKGELEGNSLARAVLPLLAKSSSVDEGLSLVLTGRAPWRTDLETLKVTLSARAIPVRKSGKRVGAIILVRNVTDARKQERELITKDATIREVHHRVKNNLQTVASLLRIQARRSQSHDAKESLEQAMRRVSAIALVHDTLSEGLNQEVNFDEVFDRVMMLTSEVAASHNTTVKTLIDGRFGQLKPEVATPLAVALTELVTNAVEHGLASRSGVVHVSADRKLRKLLITVSDNGVGLGEGGVGPGLGTQIIKTLIEGELRGSISWFSPKEGGARVSIEIPL